MQVIKTPEFRSVAGTHGRNGPGETQIKRAQDTVTRLA